MIKNVLKKNSAIMKIGFLLFFAFLNLVCAVNQVADSVKYKMKDFEKHYGDCGDQKTYCVEFSVQYPVIFDGPVDSVKTKLNNFIENVRFKTFGNGKQYKSLDSAAADIIQSFKNFKKRFPKSANKWYVSKETSIDFNKYSIVCLKAAETSFLGGAHPNTVTNYFNFSLENGKRISLTDIIKRDSQVALTKIAERVFRVDHNMKRGETYKQAGFWFKNNGFWLPDNFAIEKSGLLFYYNDYEIAPYYYGPTKILVSYKKIKELINENGIFPSQLY